MPKRRRKTQQDGGTILSDAIIKQAIIWAAPTIASTLGAWGISKLLKKKGSGVNYEGGFTGPSYGTYSPWEYSRSQIVPGFRSVTRY